MADISKADLKKEIAAVLKDADLTTMSAKKVREEIEAKLDCDLSSRKKLVDDLVMQCLKEKKSEKSSKKNGNKDSDEEEDGDGDEDEVKEEEEEEDEEDEEEEEEEKPKRATKKVAPKRKKGSSDESEDDDDKDSGDEYSPAKKAKGKPKGKGKKKKKDSDSDSDEDWSRKKGKKEGRKKKKPSSGKRQAGGYTKVCNLSPELAAVVGQDQMARHEVVKKVWSIIKEKNLYDPKNKQFAICNDDLFKIFGVKRFRTFGMMKYLKDHFVS